MESSVTTSATAKARNTTHVMYDTHHFADMSRLSFAPGPSLAPNSLRRPLKRTLHPLKRSRRCTVKRLQSYSLDDLLNELTEEERKDLSIDLEVDLEERKKQKERQEARSRMFDFADRQQLWPTSADPSGMIRAEPTEIGPDPTKGPIGTQIGTTFREAMITGEVNEDHQRYWFTEPPDGWNLQTYTKKETPIMPGFFAMSRNSGPRRRRIEELKAGDTFQGVVTEIWYHHGIKVDIGFDYDGLLPMYKETWDAMKETVALGREFSVEVEKIWNKDFYRWPIQLRTHDPELHPLIIPPEEWDPPIDARGKTLEEIEQHTNRRLPSEKRFFHANYDKYTNPAFKKKTKDLGENTQIAGDGSEISQDDYDDMMDAVWAME